MRRLLPIEAFVSQTERTTQFTAVRMWVLDKARGKCLHANPKPEAKYREWGKRLAKRLTRAPEAGNSGEYKTAYDSISEERQHPEGEGEPRNVRGKGTVDCGAYEFPLVQLLSSARGNPAPNLIVR